MYYAWTFHSITLGNSSSITSAGPAQPRACVSIFLSFAVCCQTHLPQPWGLGDSKDLDRGLGGTGNHFPASSEAVLPLAVKSRTKVGRRGMTLVGSGNNLTSRYYAPVPMGHGGPLAGGKEGFGLGGEEEGKSLTATQVTVRESQETVLCLLTGSLWSTFPLSHTGMYKRLYTCNHNSMPLHELSTYTQIQIQLIPTPRLTALLTYI